MAVINKTVDIGNGNVISIETGKLAKQADGAVMLTCGKTKILAAIVANKDASKDVDFLPLTVDYKEYFSASGKIPGGFLKREARPSDHEILSMRLVDRALRPLFPEDFHANTVMSLRLFSTDGETMPDSLVCFAASAAIAASDIPLMDLFLKQELGDWKVNG